MKPRRARFLLKRLNRILPNGMPHLTLDATREVHVNELDDTLVL